MLYRIVHISDIHLWDIPWGPWEWRGKRILGLANLILRRARRMRREEIGTLFAELAKDAADHLIVSGDLTTTSLPSEFDRFADALEGWGSDGAPLTVLPGNHDRYTRFAVRENLFGRRFNKFCEGGVFPFRKPLAEGLELIGFDPCVPNPFSARGFADPGDIDKVPNLLREGEDSGAKTFLFVCHYPGEIPPEQPHGSGHLMTNSELLVKAMGTSTVPIYWLHGHVHHPWKYPSPTVPNLTYLNPGAPLEAGEHGISLGRWVLEWNGSALEANWKSSSETSTYLVDYSTGRYEK